MNIRELMDWKLIDKSIVAGDRKEYFAAEKDIWKVVTSIMYQRKKRELDPMLKVLGQIGDVEGNKNDADIKSFTSVIADIQKFAGKADKTLDTIIKAEENWFLGSFMKLFK